MAEYFDYNSSYSSSFAESKPEPPKKSSALTVKKEAPPKSKKPLKRRNPTRQPEEVRASTAEISETADSVEIQEEQEGVKPLRKRGPAPPDGGLKRFRALLVTLDAFVGYDSKKKVCVASGMTRQSIRIFVLIDELTQARGPQFLNTALNLRSIFFVTSDHSFVLNPIPVVAYFHDQYGMEQMKG